MKIEIKRWDNQEIILSGEYENVRDCLEKNKGKSFYRADLSFADFRSADLSFADLRFADLTLADLHSANFSSADLHSAKLSSADLSSANLHSANLRSVNLYSADLSFADLRFADLTLADLHSAKLHSADLRSANLHSADLSSADLRSADLRFANLTLANFSSADLNLADLRFTDLTLANLSSAKNINKYLMTPLYGMLDQIGVIRAYKVVNEKNEGIYKGGLKYKIGELIEMEDVDTDELNQCGEGINLATLDWCIKEWKKGHKILIAEFTKEDIACIPIGSDGKFRVHRCKITGEKDLKEIGLEQGGL